MQQKPNNLFILKKKTRNSIKFSRCFIMKPPLQKCVYSIYFPNLYVVFKEKFLKYYFSTIKTFEIFLNKKKKKINEKLKIKTFYKFSSQFSSQTTTIFLRTKKNKL